MTDKGVEFQSEVLILFMLKSNPLILREDWEFSILNIFNYNKFCQLSYYFNFIKNNYHRLDGDIVEAGVYQGKSLLATALLLKELGSNKKVIGFDTFSGFPAIYNSNDNIKIFRNLYNKKKISKDHFLKVLKNQDYRKIILGKKPNIKTISQSGSFVNANYNMLLKKIKFLKLDNIQLVRGCFSETMAKSEIKNGIMGALIDCDLYESYKTSLPFIWKSLNRGGYIFLDEYYSLKFPGAKVAVDEFKKDVNAQLKRHPIMPGDFERWYLIKK